MKGSTKAALLDVRNGYVHLVAESESRVETVAPPTRGDAVRRELRRRAESEALERLRDEVEAELASAVERAQARAGSGGPRPASAALRSPRGDPRPPAGPSAPPGRVYSTRE
jgi:hypothetical protein